MVLPNPSSSSGSSSSRLGLVLLANLPQLLMATTYLLYNSLLTIMVLELEWHSFFSRDVSAPAFHFFEKLRRKSPPKGLRVSNPRGAQRSTHYLSLPYRYSIPLAVLSGALQWLTSQSLFFAEVDLWDDKGVRIIEGASGAETAISIVTLGYSNLALFWLLIGGLLAWLPVVAMGYWRTLDDGMPLMGACSAVIAAGCHLKESSEAERKGVAGGKVSWGVVEGESETGERRKWLGFSAKQPRARSPDEGETYG